MISTKHVMTTFKSFGTRFVPKQALDGHMRNQNAAGMESLKIIGEVVYRSGSGFSAN
jgi:hypothetical protein